MYRWFGRDADSRPIRSGDEACPRSNERGRQLRRAPCSTTTDCARRNNQRKRSRRYENASTRQDRLPCRNVSPASDRSMMYRPLQGGALQRASRAPDGAARGSVGPCRRADAGSASWSCSLRSARQLPPDRGGFQRIKSDEPRRLDVPAIPLLMRYRRRFVESGRRDLNPRHLAWEASALPTELRPPGSSIVPPPQE